MKSDFQIIDNPKEADVISFLNHAGNASKSFRYFHARSTEIIKNHLITIVAVNSNQENVGYGHLDPEDGKIWLGIAVAEKMQGKGLGKQILAYLIAKAKALNLSEIQLSVDTSNSMAVDLYLKFGFEFTDNFNPEIQFMKLSIV